MEGRGLQEEDGRSLFYLSLKMSALSLGRPEMEQTWPTGKLEADTPQTESEPSHLHQKALHAENYFRKAPR